MRVCFKTIDSAEMSARVAPYLRILAMSVALVYCGVASQLSAQSGAPSAEHRDLLRGTVVNGATHEPIGRALVVSQDNRFAALTDDRGRFEFVLPRADGEHTGQTPNAMAFAFGQIPQAQQQTNNRPSLLTARKTGFTFENNEMQGAAIGPEQEEVTITLVPEARVVGHVILPGGESAAGMQVELYKRQVREGRARWDQVASAAARSDGEFRFAELSSGSYKVFTREFMDRDPVTSDPRTQLFGYPPVYYPAASDFAAGAIIRLAAGETFQASLSPSRREYYPVTLGIANGVAGVQPEVQVWRQGHEGPGYSLGYDFRRGTIVGLLPNGTYTVKVVSAANNSLAGVTNVSVSGAPVSGAMVALVPSNSIAVSVVEEFQHAQAPSSMPVTLGSGPSFAASTRRPNYLQMTLIPTEEFDFRQNFSLRPPTGPEDDSLEFENVMPGSYRVHVDSGYGYVSSVNCGGTDLLRLPLVVGVGASTPPIEVTVRDDGGAVEGSIIGVANGGTRGGGGPVAVQAPGAIYFVPMNDSGQLKQSWFYADGHFQMPQLPPGSYRVLAFEHPQAEMEYASEEWMSKYDSRAQVISVAAGQTQQLRLPMISGNE
jgi:hypothetical protein